MNPRRCRDIAQRISTLLTREIGQGIDAHRMVADPLYARDVLLVCDALAVGEAPSLARNFRGAAAAAPALPDSDAGREAEGPGPSRSITQLFKPLPGSVTTDKSRSPPHRQRGWFGFSRAEK